MSEEMKELKEEDLNKVSGGNKEKYYFPDSVKCQHCGGTASLNAKSEIFAEYKCPECNYWTVYENGEFRYCAREIFEY